MTTIKTDMMRVGMNISRPDARGSASGKKTVKSHPAIRFKMIVNAAIQNA
jgi:hypothetical protein